MAIKTLITAGQATKADWTAIAQMIAGRKDKKNIEDKGWRILRPSESLPKSGCPVHSIIVNGVEFVIVELPSL